MVTAPLQPLDSVARSQQDLLAGHAAPAAGLPPAPNDGIARDGELQSLDSLTGRLEGQSLGAAHNPNVFDGSGFPWPARARQVLHNAILSPAMDDGKECRAWYSSEAQNLLDGQVALLVQVDNSLTQENRHSLRRHAPAAPLPASQPCAPLFSRSEVSLYEVSFLSIFFLSLVLCGLTTYGEVCRSSLSFLPIPLSPR